MNEKPRKRAIVLAAVAAALLTMSGIAYGLTSDSDQSPTTASDQSALSAPDGDDVAGSEQALTGDLAAQVTAAAEAAVPGGTVVRVETDDHGAAYEAHMTDADGNPVTVTFDEDLNVLATEAHGRGFGRDGDFDGDGPGSEEALTGDLAAQVTAAAEAAVPGGTVVRVETDDHGAAYEAHMTDADGNPVTVTFDEDLNVLATEQGR